MTVHAVIIVAGGSGSRMGAGVAKQFMMLGGEPVIVRTIKRFTEAIEGIRIVVAMNPDAMDEWRQIEEHYLSSTEIVVCEGGRTRFHSVLNALEHVNGCDLVGVHDAVRPMLSQEMIRRVYGEADRHGTAVPAIEPADSFRIVDKDGSSKPVDRTTLRGVQTPQVFRYGIIRVAYGQGYDKLFTDDASVVERSGVEIHLCEGERQNIKLTYPLDIEMAEALIKAGN